MAVIVADRVRETSTTTGTSNLTLAGAVTGHVTFNSAIGVNNTTYACIVNNTVPSEWEVSYCTLTASTTLARTSVIASSNSGSAVNFSAGTKEVFVTKAAETDALIDPGICEGRLSLDNANPVFTSDISSTQLNWDFYKGNRIALYDGNKWKLYTLTAAVSLACTSLVAVQKTTTANTTLNNNVLTSVASTTGIYIGQPVTGTNIPANTLVIAINAGASTVTMSANATGNGTGVTVSFYHANYDIWAYDNAGTVTLESTGWTNNTARATVLALQDGVYVKSGATTRRYLGTVRVSGTNKLDDTISTRYIWNYYNRVLRPMWVTEATASWTYTTASWRQVNANTLNQVHYVCGVSEDPVFVNVMGRAVSSLAGGAAFAIGVGVDTTTANSAQLIGAGATQAAQSCNGFYRGYPGIGWHFLAWLEISQATGTTTWFSSQFTYWNMGLTAEISC